MITASTRLEPRTVQRSRTREDFLFRRGTPLLSYDKAPRGVSTRSIKSTLAVPTARIRSKSTMDSNENQLEDVILTVPSVPPREEVAATSLSSSDDAFSSEEDGTDHEEHYDADGKDSSCTQWIRAALLPGKGLLEQHQVAAQSPVLQRRQSVQYTVSLDHQTRRNSRSVAAVGVAEEDDSTPAYVQAMIKPQVSGRIMGRRFSMVEHGTAALNRGSLPNNGMSRSASFESFQAELAIDHRARYSLDVVESAALEGLSTNDGLAVAADRVGHLHPAIPIVYNKAVEPSLVPIQERGPSTSLVPASIPGRRLRPRSRDTPVRPDMESMV